MSLVSLRVGTLVFEAGTRDETEAVWQVVSRQLAERSLRCSLYSAEYGDRHLVVLVSFDGEHGVKAARLLEDVGAKQAVSTPDLLIAIAPIVHRAVAQAVVGDARVVALGTTSGTTSRIEI